MISKFSCLARSARLGSIVGGAVLLVVVELMAARPANSQQMPYEVLNSDDSAVKIIPVRESIYVLVGAGANITVSAGPDGVMLVDSGSASASASVLSALDRLNTALQARGDLYRRGAERGGSETRSNAPWHPNMNFIANRPKQIRYIVNTSYEDDHVGGNDNLAKTGITYAGGNVAGTISDAGAKAEVLAHENVLLHMLDNGKPYEAYPTFTYASGEMKLSTFFNGDGIRLVHMPRGHASGDTIVHFRQADVISAGALFSMESYPVIDVKNGGSINGVVDALNYMLKLAIPEFRTEGGTMIIPGRGRIGDSADLGYYRDMVTIIRDHVKRMRESGMTLEQVQAAVPTKGYDARFGSTTGPWTTNMFVEAVYRSVDQ